MKEAVSPVAQDKEQNHAGDQIVGSKSVSERVEK